MAGGWTLSLSPASAFEARVCLPTSHITTGLTNFSQLRVVQRADAGASWSVLSTLLLPSAAAPTQACADVTGPGEFTLVNRQLGLPVELTTFAALADGAGALLRWQTASEVNNAGFAVEQQDPTRAAAWLPVAFVDGHGTTAAAHAYSYRIAQLAPGLHRFRLRQLDLDGTAHVSADVAVEVDARGRTVAVGARAEPRAHGHDGPLCPVHGGRCAVGRVRPHRAPRRAAGLRTRRAGRP